VHGIQTTPQELYLSVKNGNAMVFYYEDDKSRATIINAVQVCFVKTEQEKGEKGDDRNDYT